jgi:hypothetical protein
MPRLHPFTTASFTAIELRATARFAAGGLALSFSLSGNFTAFALPSPAAPNATGERRDRLWQSTCWECFVAAANAPDYFEINLSPTHHWNIYHFTAYRQGMTAPPIPTPSLRSWREDDCYQLDALVSGLPLASDPANWRLGLAAVLVTAGGGYQDYFALVHPGIEPDFHHPDGFIFRLAP